MVLSILKKAMRKAFKVLYWSHDEEIGVMNLDKYEPIKAGYNKALHCRKLMMEDIELIEKRFGKTVSKKFAARMENSTGYLIFHRDEIAGYVWSSTSLCKNEGVKPFLYDIRPKKDSVYLYDIFILPGKRKTQAGIFLSNYQLLIHKEAGFKMAFTTYGKKHLAMNWISRRLGGEVVGRMTYRRYLWHVIKDTSDLDKVCESS